MQDQFLDAVYWTRQVVALTSGLIWGYLGVTGAIGLIAFALANTLFVYIFTSKGLSL
jgi:hypothetical protein